MKKVKLLVWDLDNTLWDGTLLEGDDVTLFPEIKTVIEGLDKRGILLSIASKNTYDDAMAKLREFGLDEYFLCPQINWNSKAESIEKIAKTINIGIDSLAFIDDLEAERAEVSFSHDSVLTIDAKDYLKILDMDAFMPEFITEDSTKRRHMYMNDLARNAAEDGFVGSSEEFLKSLDMKLSIAPVSEEDLKRVYELTVRTNQLNSTGYTYSYDELLSLVKSDKHIFLIAGLTDKFGDYGKIGLALIEKSEGKYVLKLMLMSCRVMTKGIGTTMLTHIIKLAERDNVELYTEFLETPRNRVMYITYKFMGFEEIENNAGKILFKYESDAKREYPDYLEILL